MRTCAVLLAGSILVPFAAGAQTPPPASAAAPPTSSGLEEIVVTAQRRAESQQNVPISITTLTATALANAGVSSTDQLIATTPGVTITTSQRGAQIFVRGVGTLSVTPGDESNVSSYIDGVYINSAYGSIMSFNNIARVEVLKGPQGTLFGRNATGGLIQVVTKDPKPGFSGEANVSYGNYNTIEGSAYVTGGSDTLAADLAFYGIHQGDGWGHNLNTGRDVNRARNMALRSKLLWTPSDSDKLTLMGDWSKTQSDPGITRTGLPGAIQSAGAAGQPAFVARTSIYDTISNLDVGPSDINYQNWGVALKYEHDFDFAKLNFLSAYRNSHSVQPVDSDTGPYRIIEFVTNYRDRSFQNEAYLSGTTGRLDWTAGAIAYSVKSIQHVGVRSSLILSQNINNTGQQDTQSYAGYAQGTYAIFANTKLTLGARYTTDRRELSANRVTAPGNPLGAGVTTLTVSGSDHHTTFNKFTFRAGLDQKLGRDVMVYVTQSRGFKSGTYNTSSPTDPAVKPEVLDATEIGLKSELFDRTLRLNVAGFHYNYKNIQLSRAAFINNAIITQLVNAAKSRINGVDVEAVFAPRMPVGDLQLRLAGTYLDAKYSSFPNAPITVPRGLPAGGNQTILGDASGNRMIRSPKVTLNATVDYSVPVGPGDLAFNLTVFHSAKYYFEADNRVSQPAFETVNGQVSYAFGPDHKYRVRVYGRNLFDKAYYLGVQEGSFGDLVWPSAPRTFGGGFDVKF